MTFEKKVWDPLVRIFHWTLVGCFAANAIIVDPEAKAHLWIGYTIIGLVTFRIIWGVIGTKYARFSSFPPNVSASLQQVKDMLRPQKDHHIGHTPLGALMIYNLILTLAGIGVSGYLMTTDMFWGVEWPEEVHEALVTWAEISALAHIAAVIFESRRTQVNLVKAMITGRKQFKT
jgi:cytochrome b